MEKTSMNEGPKTPLLSNDQVQEHPKTLKSKTKGGLITMPSIIVNESFEKVASYGLMPNLIFYLMNGYHLEAANGSIVLSLWSAASNFLAIFGAFLSDSYLGRFRVIALGTLASLLGTTLLWSTSMFPWMKPPPCIKSSSDCDSATPLQYLVLFGSFGLISIGAGCVRPCSIAFGADQFYDKENPNNERVLDSFFNWYYGSTGLSSIIALTIVVYIQDHFGWQIGFGVPVCLMILSLIAFLLGFPFYVHVKPKESLFTSLVQVPVAAFRKRKLFLPPPDAEEGYFYENDSKTTLPTENLRCLNRACIIEESERESNPNGCHGSISNSWTLCSVERVETVKAIARLIPISTTGIMVLVTMNNSYTTLQAKTMNRHLTSRFEIPAGTFSIFQIITITVWVAFYDRVVVPLLGKYLDMPRGLPPKFRMGFGIALSCLASLVAGFVESIRREIAINEGLEDKPDTVVGMSAMWLAPQLVLIGLGEAFNGVGQIEFFYSHLSKSMSSFAMALFTLEMGFSGLLGSFLVKMVDKVSSSGGKVSWLATNLNKGHVDYYYWMMSVLCLVNFLYFLICCKAYGASQDDGLRNGLDCVDPNSDYRDLPSV
ncbi:hypothetical protein RND81_02G202700 [Saponaria officinalis]|uniref:Uncharacterized protein n=1 Tax=Saponaria officinalis TaxID=3572 RepID=A0AAW1MWC0_SAPOF